VAVSERVIYGDDENARKGFQDFILRAAGKMLNDRQADADADSETISELQPVSFERVVRQAPFGLSTQGRRHHGEDGE